MDALKRTLGITGSDTSERFQPNFSSSPQNHYEVSGGTLDTISASMVVVDGPPSLDQRGIGGCIEASSMNGYDSTGSPGNNSNSSTEGPTSSAPQMKERLVSMWNNMKFSKTIWALDSKKANAFSSSSGSSFNNCSPVWVMGRYYQTNYSKDGLSRQSSYDSTIERQHDIFGRDGTGLEASAAGIDALTSDFHSKVWMTYRKDFEVFKGTHVDTDCGWGCMIRAGQMIVSNALISLHLGRHWRWKCDEKRSVFTGDDIQNEGTHRAIIRLFADDSSAPFSIHKIVEMGQETINCKPGDWFGPGSTAHLLKQAIHSAQKNLPNGIHSATSIPDWSYINLISSFKIYVATDGTIYKQDVRDMCDSNSSEILNEKDKNINLGKCSLEKEGDFSFLDRPDASVSSFGEIAGSFKEVERYSHKSLEKRTSEGFTQLENDMEMSCTNASINHNRNESFDSVTEAVLLDDGVIRQYSLSQQLSVDGETWLTEEFSANPLQVSSSTPLPQEKLHKHKETTNAKPIPSKNCSVWAPVLLLVPVRLGGGEKLNPIYAECVKALLANENCVGIIGGRPRHALYFVGFQDDSLIHLDPHLVQDNVPMIDRTTGEHRATTPLEFDLTSYHCQSIRKMQLSRMDPSCCIGFLCKTSSDFENWSEIVRDLATPSGATDYPIFSIMEGRVSDHLIDSENLFSQCLDGDTNDGPVDNENNHPGKLSKATGGTNSDSDNDDFVFL